ncbi:unnamed protein product [Clonostachys chloroleuca]|uniref:Major facilitator superfamily (MFS) profile domain-containing protein n=1 Tax=Clonostachys chloroleuca TaxID=1926264 RepID=A0AA35VIP1_9HYPO|nr:unnamed protein product [Clonostachys chloroleuca]
MPVFDKLMPNYVTASIALSFGGLLNGYDTGSIGAIVHMEQFKSSMGGTMSAFITGITVSTIMLTGIIPALFAGHLADKYGRLRLIAPGALVFGIGALLQATSTQLPQFIIGRAISGAGQGVFFGNITVYITEVAPLRSRGRLSALPQFMATTGVCIGYFACVSTTGQQSSLAWRLPYIVQVSVSAGLALVCRFLPESPRWLALQGRGDEAQISLARLDFDLNEARRDFLATVQEQSSLSNWQSFVLLFRRGYRPKTFLALFILSMIQLSGIDAITYQYAPSLFDQAGISSTSSSLIASGVSSIAMLLVSIPGFLLADRWGRRTSAISGGLLLAGIMLLMGTLYASGAVTPRSAASWVVVVCVFLFGMIFCATWGIVGKIYASEILPGNTRAAGNSVGMACSFLTNWVVALITPVLLNASAFGAYFLFSGLALFTVGVLAIRMPETRGRSLEDIQASFRGPAQGLLSSLFRQQARTHQGAATVANDSGPALVDENQQEEIELQATAQGTALARLSSIEAAARGFRVETS